MAKSKHGPAVFELMKGARGDTAIARPEEVGASAPELPLPWAAPTGKEEPKASPPAVLPEVPSAVVRDGPPPEAEPLWEVTGGRV
ncbi:MAG: hypothetical protein V2A79_04320, partial [Planctomycetota bacterium]